jgi:hypothetical protein
MAAAAVVPPAWIRPPLPLFLSSPHSFSLLSRPLFFFPYEVPKP